MNDNTAAAPSAPPSATTKKTTRKRGGRGRKKVAPSDIAEGSTPAPQKNEQHTEQKSEPRVETPRPAASSTNSGSNNKPRQASRMLINYIPGDECRVALTVGGKLEEFHSERANNLNIVGNIYVGKVMNVERSIQAAFVDFGYGVNGFLHISDLHPQYFPGEDENTTEKIGMKTPRRERPPIERCLKRGQKIIVQVLKEGISTKGPTLTSYLSIPGRFLVMLPDMDKVGVSRKVEDEDQRRAMRKILDSLDLPSEFGFILRTAGMNQTKAELKRDLAYLQRLWKDIDKRLGQGDKPRLLYAESDLLMRALRDIWTSDIEEIIVDDPGAIRRAYAFMRIVSPRSTTKLLAYDRPVPLFHAFGVEEQIERILSREVPLPSGGSLIIDEAEAMVAIDVNSGKSRNHGDAETMAFRINQEAVEEICRQIKLRDVGGLIMCDLIDMMKRSHRREIEKLMEDLLRKDRASTRALPISEFGIMEMTRQRVRGSMKSVHFAKLDIGDGRGWVRRPDSVATNAMRDLAALLQHERVGKVEMVVSPRVAGELLSSKRQALTRLELKLHKRVDVRVSESIAVDRVVMYAYDESGVDIELERLPAYRPPTDLNEYRPEAAEDQDWSVDATAEHQQDLEELVHEEASKLDDILAMEGDLLSEADADDEGDSSRPESSAGNGKKRRRRRRRRGGSRPEGEDQHGDGSDREQHADGSQDDDDSDDGREEASDHDADHQQDRQSDEQNGDGEPRKRRRRRRRRRGGGGGSDSPGHPDAEQQDRSDDGDSRRDDDSRDESDDDDRLVASGRQIHVEPKAPVREGVAPSGFPWRGDSWDLEPSALTIGPDGGFKNPADAKAAADLKAGREPEGASNGVVKDARRDPEGSGDSGNGDGDDNGSRPRRRRRRRGGRSNEGESDNGDRQTGDSAREAGKADAGGSPTKAEARSEDGPKTQPEAKVSRSSDEKTVMPPPTPDAQRQTGRKVAAMRKGQKKAPADILIPAAVKPVSKVSSRSSKASDKAESSAVDEKKASSKKTTTKKPTTKKATTKKTTTKKPASKKKAATKKKTTKKSSS